MKASSARAPDGDNSALMRKSSASACSGLFIAGDTEATTPSCFEMAVGACLEIAEGALGAMSLGASGGVLLIFEAGFESTGFIRCSDEAGSEVGSEQ